MNVVKQLSHISRCCGTAIVLAEGDGRKFGVCTKCRGFELRLNPVTQRLEWLDPNESPWSMHPSPVAGPIDLPS